MHLEKAIFVNRAPFENLELDFKEKGVNVLTSINGKGKTTILSYIVDAFYEMAKKYYTTSFEGRENYYYRISSGLYDLNPHEPSLVYLEFDFKGRKIDYLDFRGKISKVEYEKLDLHGKITYEELLKKIGKEKSIKMFFNGLNTDIVKQIFKDNVMTYFPSYRYEQPSFLTEKYNVHQEYKAGLLYSKILRNPIEVVSNLQQVVNWIMDLVLDEHINQKLEGYKDETGKLSLRNNSDESVIHANVNVILTNALTGKCNGESLRFGIGRRNRGLTRLSILKTGSDHKVVAPSFLTLSSGEQAIISLFVEVLKQGDVLNTNTSLEKISGMVLIDEVDMHLHIKLQKEVLPKMFKLFPNVQFIVSSHSPFLNMGLGETMADKCRIFDLHNGGLVSTPTANDLYEEVYKMMIDENNRFAQMYNDLKKEVDKSVKPLIITEGKTDVIYLKKAQDVLFPTGIDVDYMEIPDDWGSKALMTFINKIGKTKPSRKIIAIFDRDEDDILKEIGSEKSNYKDFGNNVYAFAIPIVNEDIYGTNKISIEHYFKKEDLTKLSKEGRRIFLGREFSKSGLSLDKQYYTKISKLLNKIEINGVIDDKVFKQEDLDMSTNLALSKKAFAKLVLDDPDFAKDFDFSNFGKIFEIIELIIEG